MKDLAKNFQKAFQLNSNMLHLLIHQLEQHLQNYKDKQGIVNDDNSTFPMNVSHIKGVSTSKKATRSVKHHRRNPYGEIDSSGETDDLKDDLRDNSAR